MRGLSQENLISQTFQFARNLEKFVAVWDFEPSKKDEVALSKVKLNYCIFLYKCMLRLVQATYFEQYFAYHKHRLSNVIYFKVLTHYFVWVIAWGRVKLRINITRVFRNCRNCPSRAATRAISAISENTSDVNP